MSKQNLLTPIYSNLTGKQVAKLVIGYFLQEIAEEVSYQKQIDELVNTLTFSTGPEYNFYWNLFTNLQLLSPEIECTYLKLELSYSVLSKYNLYTLMFLALDTERVKKLNLNFESIEEVLPKTVQNIEFNLTTINSYLKIVTDIEHNYFDSERIVLRNLVFDKIVTLKKNCEKHNEHIKSVFFGNEKIFQTVREHSEGNKDAWVISQFDEIDNQWVKAQYDMIVSYAKKDSGYEKLESNFFKHLFNKKKQNI